MMKVLKSTVKVVKPLTVEIVKVQKHKNLDGHLFPVLGEES
jgi:hypothetical protein